MPRATQHHSGVKSALRAASLSGAVAEVDIDDADELEYRQGSRTSSRRSRNISNIGPRGTWRYYIRTAVITLDWALAIDRYCDCRETSGFMLIDCESCDTIGMESWRRSNSRPPPRRIKRIECHRLQEGPVGATVKRQNPVGLGSRPSLPSFNSRLTGATCLEPASIQRASERSAAMPGRKK